MIPREISAEHVKAAIAEIDKDGVPYDRESTKYDLIYKGNSYPPKYVVSVAAKYAVGYEWPSGKFNGGKETNAFLQSRGFKIKHSVAHEGMKTNSRQRSRKRIPVRSVTKETRQQISVLVKKVKEKIDEYVRDVKQRTTGHKDHCRECKSRVLALLQALYGVVEVQKRFEVVPTTAAFEVSAYWRDLMEIFAAIRRERGFTDFVRAAALPACDYFVPQPGMIVEFDESQHFTALRELSLSRYPSALQLGFDREEWIGLCRRIRARDNDPAYRDEQRAWYDTLRDFLPTILNLHPTIRLYEKELQWCSLDAKRPADLATFRQILAERADFWKLEFSHGGDAAMARIVIDGAWSGDPTLARRLLFDVCAQWPAGTHVRCISTCGAFLTFPWPAQFPRQRVNRSPEPEAIEELATIAEQTCRELLSGDLRSKLQQHADYVTLGVDSYKDNPLKTWNSNAAQHCELVCVVDLRTAAIHVTGKSYPTSEQEGGLLRITDLTSHFVDLGNERTVVLGCHDLNMFSRRSDANAGAWRMKVKNEFKRLMKTNAPSWVLHHPHTAVKRSTWREGWNGLMALHKGHLAYLGTGAYSRSDPGWNERDDPDDVLRATARGPVMDIVASVGLP